MLDSRLENNFTPNHYKIKKSIKEVALKHLSHDPFLYSEAFALWNELLVSPQLYRVVKNLLDGWGCTDGFRPFT